MLLLSNCYQKAKRKPGNPLEQRVSRALLIIPTRSLKPFLKQLCIVGLACGIHIACIIHYFWAIGFFVAKMLPSPC